MTQYSTNVQTVLDILQNEVDGNVRSALEKMSEDYSMTWMYKHGKEIFPTTGKSVGNEMDKTYAIKGRKYDIRNIAEGEGVVMVELIESYPDPETGKTYRTPLVLVLEMENGKIKKGRHYMDPNVSFLHLSEEEVEKGLKGTERRVVIE